MILALLLALFCGHERTAEKVLADPGAAKALASAPIHSTIAKLGALPRTARRRAYVIEGVIAAIKHEADGDLHLVLRDGAATMIVEAPDPGCAQGSQALSAIRRARLQASVLRVGMKVRAVGILFFDRPHNETGHAPGFQELHPLLSIRRLP